MPVYSFVTIHKQVDHPTINQHGEAAMPSNTLSSVCALKLAFILSIAVSSLNAAGARNTIEFLGMTGKLPASWIEEKPSSSMRLAQYRIPGSGNNSNANLILFYFGQGQGGSAKANIARWQSQFSNPEGGHVEPMIDVMDVNGIPVTVVELRGDYARGVGMGPVGTAVPDQILLASIIESARGNIYIQLHGPAATVALHREAYMQFIRTIKP